MQEVFVGFITDAEDLRKVKERLATVHEWGAETYVEGLRADIDCLVTNTNS